MTTGGGDTETLVLSALEVLYQKQLQPEQQQAADAYLRGFQLTPDAVRVCVALLERFLASASSTPILFFASQTLANRLRRSAGALVGQWTYLQWSQQLVQWLAAAPHSKIVHTQLVIALSACIPRISASEVQGGSSLGFVLDELTRARASGDTVAELLVVVVEEARDVQERAARERVFGEIDAWAVRVLDQLLPQLMHEAIEAATSGGGSSHKDPLATQQMVLRAVKSWLRDVPVNSDVIVQNPLVQSLLVFLAREELFDVTVELVVELVRCYCDVQRDLVLIQWFIPQLMQLQETFKRAAEDEDTDKCAGLCRIFTEMGESYMSLLLGDQELNQVVVVDLLLECMDYPDTDIADVTIPFWTRFLEDLQHQREPRKSALLATFTPSIMRLASICMRKLQFEDSFPSMPVDRQQDFKAFRVELGDILRDCCDVLGVLSILQHCVQGLEQIFQSDPASRRWEAIEAHLYCFRSIARHVERSKEATTGAPIQTIFEHLPQFATHPAIAYTACLIVSRYAPWLRDHPAYLQKQIEFLNQVILNSANDKQCADWEVARAAATAIRSLAIDCWPTMGAEITGFYQHIELHEIMNVEDQVLMLEGVCAGVAASRDMAAILAVLDRIMEPIGQRLSALFASAAASGSASYSVAMNELLRLMCIYEFLDVDMKGCDPSQQHPLMALTEKIWPWFNQILALFRSHDELVERVCRCYKRILRTCGAHFKPFLPQMVDNILSFYQTEPKSSYLYSGSMIIKHFYDDSSPEMVQLFTKMVHMFAEMTMPLFKDIASVSSHPYVVEEFFFMLERCVKCVPGVLLLPTSYDSSPLLTSVFQCAIVSLKISHNDANKGALTFLEQALAEAGRMPSADPQSFSQVLSEHLLGSQSTAAGTQLVNDLMRGVVLGAIPPSRVEADYGSIAGVLVQFATLNGQQLQQWIGEWFASAFASSVVTFLTTEDAEEFQRELFTAANERAFRRSIRHFGKLCGSRNASLTNRDQE